MVLVMSELFYEPIGHEPTEPAAAPSEVLALVTAFRRDLLAYWEELKPLALREVDREKALTMVRAMLTTWFHKRWAGGLDSHFEEALFVCDLTNNKEDELRCDVTVNIPYGHIFRWSLT
jgi:hypothetical protein